jgi:hypothetical protein
VGQATRLASGSAPCTTDTSCGNHFLPCSFARPAVVVRFTMKQLVVVSRGILHFANELHGQCRTYGVSLRGQPGSRDYHQESHVLFSTANERVTSFDDPAGTTRHPISVSVYPQKAQSSRLLFKADRPLLVVAVALLFSVCSFSERKRCSARVSLSMSLIVHSQK